jgi:hypothetical protein
MNRIVLVDAKNLFYRAHYAFKDLRTSRGKRTSVLHGFPSLLADVQAHVGKADIIIAWDGLPPFPREESYRPPPYWRIGLWPLYKQNRNPKNPEVEAAGKQLPALGEMLSILGFLQIGVPTLEADDIIGLTATALAAREKVERVWIYSNDRDLWQLAGGKIRIISPTGSGKIGELNAKGVETSVGVAPDRIAHMKALAGDIGDNYKPLKGLGDVGAIKMLLAGVNPALDLFDDHPPKVQEEFRAKLADAWPLIRRCYDLAHIPRESHDPRIAGQRVGIEAAILDARKRRTRRASKIGIDKMTRKFLQFCNRFELTSVFQRRRAFFEFIEPL